MVTQRTPINPVAGNESFEVIIPGLPPDPLETLSSLWRIHLNFAEHPQI